MTDLVIRAATPDDVPTIVDFNIRLAEETEETVLDARIVRDGVRTLLSEPVRGRYDVACVEGAVVGQIMADRSCRPPTIEGGREGTPHRSHCRASRSLSLSFLSHS